MRITALFASLLLLPATSFATVWAGAPIVSFEMDRSQGDYTGGTVDVDKLRVTYCGGGYTEYSINETGVDPTVGTSVTITGGDICGIAWRFSSVIEIDGDGTQGTFTVEADDTWVNSPVGASIPWVAVGPWEVTAGTMVGGGPELLTTIQ